MIISRDEYFRVCKMAMAGDLIGSSLETGELNLVKLTFDEVINKVSNGKSHFTDETDLLCNIHSFLMKRKSNKTSHEKLLIDWCKFITNNHSSNRYGKTHKDLFNYVKWYETHAHNELTVAGIKNISKDIKSFGNGFLQTIFPLYYFFTDIFESSKVRRLAIFSFTELTYTHNQTIHCLSGLLDIIMPWYQYDIEKMNIVVSNLYKKYSCSITRSSFVKKFPNNIMCEYTFAHALWGIYKSHGSFKKLITNIAGLGGDVDSVMACAFLLDAMINNHSIEDLKIDWINEKVNKKFIEYF